MGMVSIVKIGSFLLVSVQSDLNDSMAERLQDQILERIQQTNAKAVLIDVTVLDIVDSFIARILAETSAMASMMNAEVVLVGIRPAVTMTLVDMGMMLPGIKTATTIEQGLRKLGYRLEFVRTSSSEEESENQMERNTLDAES